MTRNLDMNAKVGKKRPTEVMDQLLIQGNGRLERPFIAAQEERNARLPRARESVLIEFVRLV